MVRQGDFREDLYARISTLELDIIGLDKRHEDIKPITLSLDGGKEFLEHIGDRVNELDLSLNVRSIQKYVIRYKVLGRI
jgi:transcriptional regulator with PAS, ATPase and Fis domain